MNILLIYPGLVDGFGSYYTGSDWANHGVGIISAILKREGHAVHYMDCRQRRGWHDVRKSINAVDFDMALISVATVDFQASKKIAKIIKEKGNIPVMVGGPHPTLVTEETNVVKDFDFIFTHEAEITLPKLLTDIENDNLLTGGRMFWRFEHRPPPRIIHGEMPPDLDAIPFVDRDLAPEGETPMSRDFPKPYFAITASRGCFGKCLFCQPAEREVFGNKVRKRSTDNVLGELYDLQNVYKMKSFFIHDDCFTQFTAWVEDFCRKKSVTMPSVPFGCQSRADIICRNPAMMQRLYDAGLRWTLIGFESGSDRILKYLKKGVTVEQNLEAREICRKIGIKVSGNIMMGLPTETESEMRETVAMVRKMKPDRISPAAFTPAPGSELYIYCKENNLILQEGTRRTAFSGAKIRHVNYKLVNWLTAEMLYGKFWGPLYYVARTIAEKFYGTRFYGLMIAIWRKI